MSVIDIMNCQFALNILQSSSYGVGGFPAEDEWWCTICIAGSAGLVSCTWRLGSSIVIPLPSDQLVSPAITPRARKNPWILIYIPMIIKANKIFTNTQWSYVYAQRISYAADLYACTSGSANPHIRARTFMRHRPKATQSPKHTHKFCIVFFLFLSSFDSWMLFCCNYSIDF